MLGGFGSMLARYHGTFTMSLLFLFFLSLTHAMRLERPPIEHVHRLRRRQRHVQPHMKISAASASKSAALFTTMTRTSDSVLFPRVKLFDHLDDVPQNYNLTWSEQKGLLAERLDSLGMLPLKGAGISETCPIQDSMILVEHAAVVTLGTSTVPGDLLGLLGEMEAIKVDRGGEATYHGPGQLVAYPVFDLRRYQKDVHWYELHMP